MGILFQIARGGTFVAIVAAFSLALVKPEDTHSGIGPPVLPDSLLHAIPRPAPAPAQSSEVKFSADADAYGQFWIMGTANGVAFKFLADTGASDVSFSKRDARRLGIDITRLSFTGRASTANGLVRTAETRVARLSVGPFTVTDFPVSINEGELDFPLLGMTFLQRMHVGINNGTLTLTSKP